MSDAGRGGAARDGPGGRASAARLADELSRAQRRIAAETAAIEGWLREADTWKLVELAYHRGDAILEVGTWAGRSAVVELSGALANPRRAARPRLYGVDVAVEALDETYRTLARRGLARDAALFRGTLAELAAEHRVRPTMVFVDGGHRYEEVRADLRALSDLLAPGTPVFGHDFTNSENDSGEYGVRRAFEEWEAAGDARRRGIFGCGALYETTARCRGERPAPLAVEAFEAERLAMRARHDPVRQLSAEGFTVVRAGFAPQPLRFALGTAYPVEPSTYAGRAVEVQWARSPALLLVENPNPAREVVLQLDLGGDGGPHDVALELNGERQTGVFAVERVLWESEATRAAWRIELRPGDNVLRLLDGFPARALSDGREVSWLVLGEPWVEAA